MKRGPLGGVVAVEPFSKVVSTANQWIETASVQVMNVETIVLPSSSTGQTVAPPSNSLDTGGGIYRAWTGDGYINWYQCVRIWYRDLV